MKKITFSVIVTELALSSTIAYAENDIDSTVKTRYKILSTHPTVNPISNRLQISDAHLQERKEVRASTTAEIKVMRQENKAEIKAKIDERNTILMGLRAKLASSTQERRDARGEAMRKVAMNRVRMMIQKIQSAIDRELYIAGKITNRITKIKTNGGNTAAAEGFVAEAKIHFGEAQSILDSIKSASTTVAAAIDASVTATSTKDSLMKIKNITGQIEIHMKAGHKALVDAVVSLKGLSDKKTATSTSSTNL